MEKIVISISAETKDRIKAAALKMEISLPAWVRIKLIAALADGIKPASAGRPRVYKWNGRECSEAEYKEKSAAAAIMAKKRDEELERDTRGTTYNPKDNEPMEFDANGDPVGEGETTF